MTITDMARMMMNADQYQSKVTQPKYPNGAAVSDPNAPDDGLDITGMTAADFHIIPVSKEAGGTGYSFGAHEKVLWDVWA